MKLKIKEKTNKKVYIKDIKTIEITNESQILELI
jgi:hypothetical protein